MKTEHELEMITRELMKNTSEEPSPMLGANIMKLIFKEKTKSVKCYITDIPKAGRIIAAFCIYALLIAGLFYLTGIYGTQMKTLLGNEATRSCLLLAASVGSFFFLFTQLDRWLRIKTHQS